MSKASLFSAHRSERHCAPSCPQCAAALVVRQGRQGAFLGCSRYPDCDYRRPLKNQPQSHIVKQLDDQHCPDCQSPLVLRQGRYGMFICCASYPDCAYHQRLSQADDTAIACPQCTQGHLLARQSRYGKTFYSCNRYPACQFSVNLPPVSGVCPFCQYPLLLEKQTANGVKRYCASKQCGKLISD